MKWYFYVIIILVFLLIVRFDPSTQSSYSNFKDVVLDMSVPKEVQPLLKRTRKKTEDKCRDIFEKITNKPFPTTRPGFLMNPETGKNLELDGYNPELQLAFEYSGRQHYKYVSAFHSSETDLHEQVKRDTLKAQLCKENGIHLIVIPYTVHEDVLEDYIKDKIQVYINSNG